MVVAVSGLPRCLGILRPPVTPRTDYDVRAPGFGDPFGDTAIDKRICLIM
jgi:hypothetical protein